MERPTSQRWRTVLLAVVIGHGPGALPSRGQPDLPPIPPTDPQLLFNRRNLDGWYSWLVDTRYDNSRGVFGVRQGHLRISGDGMGYLATEGHYQDYWLTVEFRWGTQNHRERIGKARDSGIFLHAQGPDGNSADGNGAFMAAIECQIMEGAVGDLMLIRGADGQGQTVPLHLSTTVTGEPDSEGWSFFAEPNRRGQPLALDTWGRVNRLGKRRDWQDRFGLSDTSGLERPTGQWNRLDCVCRGDTIRIYLNGHLVNSAHAVVPSRGRILLQCEGSEVFFRRVDIWALAADR